MRRVARPLLVALGSLCVALGVLGVFLPLLPTTPFLLVAAWCYARGSQRFHRWLLGNRWFGPRLRDYREGRGVLLADKVVALVSLWLTIGVTTALAVEAWWARAALWAVAAATTVHLLRLRTRRADAVPAARAAAPRRSAARPRDRADRCPSATPRGR
uniref:DUF454 domain-containing protein n=1 Tax=Eiseniibacteriota bacterium TaxID=2212470 RepID=A0A832MMH8_UNCEI